ncbi:MAG TPA: ABC transporter substrate-binding protein [Methylomirabilota bacterium]|jgi:peptide/nickel transport system substrate-binding protein|nr:ABC transporter substrate-binding protein [Methylomirabilota bacterium]
MVNHSRSAPFAVAVGVLLVAVVGLGLAAPAGAAPEGEMTWAVHVSLAPTWFDPAETPSVITPFMVLYALHDAMVKPMPGNPTAPGLAESWTVSRDGLAYEFVLRKGVRFHNGDPVTADDVKFSLERYRGGAATTLKERVAGVDVIDPQRVRIRLKQPWPDFMTFYGTPATGAAWIVPKRYLERVGEDGFRKAPVGAGPYRFVSFTPGIELVLEANEGYWRKTPSVKRLIFRSVPDDTTRLAMLKRGEADVAYSIRGPLAEEVRRTPGLTLKATSPTFTEWLTFTEQWDPKSPWADRRVRLAANLAIDRKALNDAEYLGFARISSSIIPRDLPFYWPAPPYPHDPARARQLLAEAGYPRGFDAGDVTTDTVYAATGEAVINNFLAVGIRAKLRPLERAAFYKGDQEKSFKKLVRPGSAAPGNAATRIEAFVLSSGIRSYGGYPDIDALFREQATELDTKKRETLLHRIQQLMHERAMFAPILEPAFLSGHGPRVEQPGFGLIAGTPYTLPYEDLRLKPVR